MDIAECSACGQTIIQWPFESDWNHYDIPEKPIDWPLTDQKGCYCNARPVKEKWYAKRNPCNARRAG